MLLGLWLSLIGITLSACSQVPVPTQPVAQEPAALKFAALRILDALPIHVAQQQGYFEKYGVQVEFVPVSSAPERDQLLAAGQVDGVLNEVLSVILMNQETTQAQVVRFARTATGDSPLFRILASPQSGITDVDGLKGVEIGISNATVIEYVNERLLQAEGFQAGEIKTLAVPNLSDRLALMNSGQLPAGVLPDPLASLAMSQGAVDVLDDSSHPEYSFSTLTFRKATLDQHPDAVRGFLAAIEDAVDEINADSSRFQGVLLEQQILPEALKDQFTIPAFVTAGVPSEAQYADVLAWAIEKGLAKENVAYTESVNPGFLPDR
jgi:NitT/TauT family transport system substrate-binding protein